MVQQSKFIKVLVTGSFPYKWRNRQTYLTSGEWLTFDTEKDADQVAYLRSSSFPYRDCIFIDGETKEPQSQDLNRMEQELHQVPMVPSYTANPDRVSALYPTQQATENPHILETLEAAGVVLPQNTAPVRAQLSKGLDIPMAEPGLVKAVDNSHLGVVDSYDDLQKVIVTTPVKSEVVEEESPKDGRRKELKHMHTNKLKQIAASYQLVFEERQKAIEEILNIEFPESK